MDRGSRGVRDLLKLGVVIGILTFGGLWFLLSALAWPAPIHTDQVAMSRTVAALQPLRAEIDALEPAGTVASGPASIDAACRSDSGDLLGQPDLGRAFTIRSGNYQTVLDAVEGQLRSAGWSPAVKRTRGFGYEDRTLLKQAGGNRYRARLSGYSPFEADDDHGLVLVGVFVEGEEPCTQG